MVRAGLVLFLGIVIGSMAVAMYVYTLYQPSITHVGEGEPVVVGPVEYSIRFQGIHPGSNLIQPEDSFVQVRIDMFNMAEDDVTVTGGQFYIIDAEDGRHQPTYGNRTMSPDDLLLEVLKPGVTVSRITQFDIPFEEDFQYQIIIRPAKEHNTPDVAMVCITNC